jgi:capsular polysaccharide transport system permease protein
MPAAQIQPDAPGPARAPPGPKAQPPLPFPARPAIKAGAIASMPVPGQARWHSRHGVLAASFLLAVIFPALTAGWYLFARAEDQFRADLGFAIRGEAGAAALVEGMAGLAALAGSSSSDSAILEEFLHSTALVARIDARLDLGTLWHRDRDPVFGYQGDATEDLARYWSRMVRLSTRPGSGLIGVSVTAFAPHDAARIAGAIQDESERLINDLSRAARDDALRHGTEDLARVILRLTESRQAMVTFRAESRLVDPAADISGEMDVVADLQRKLSEEMVTLELLRNDAAGPRTSRNAEVSGARIALTERRIVAITGRISAEREKFGGLAEHDYAQLLSRFEALSVELEFAQQSYVAALAALDVARIEARRQSRYLAIYETPLVPETATAPLRGLILASVTLAALLVWSVVALSVYGMRDRM